MKPSPKPDPALWPAYIARRLQQAMHAAAAVSAYVLLVLWALLLALVPALSAAAMVAAVAGVPAAAAVPLGGTAAAAGAADGAVSMSVLQWALALVALGNFLLALSAWHSAKQKAATARLEMLEQDVREQLSAHANELARLSAADESAITHEHLADVYRDIKAVAAQINTMSGQQAEMNNNLRLVLAKLMGKG